MRDPRSDRKAVRLMPVDWSRYPSDWLDMRADALDEADHACETCGIRPGEDGTQRSTLTVHHPDRNPESRRARLTVLCAACHLMVEPRARYVQRRRAQGWQDAVVAAGQMTIGDESAG